MKKLYPFLFTVVVSAFICSCNYLGIDAFSGSTLIWESGANNYFNRDKPHDLPFSGKILITGEVEKDVYIKTNKLPWHSVTVKETVPCGDSLRFLGAFRYDGYALADILSTVKVDKWNKEEFYPPVDLYAEVWNDKGEMALFSWGEIFYSADVYNIIVARSVSRVIPGKTGELWELPQQSKIVCGSDLFSVRNISNPVKIVIRTIRGDFKVDRNPEYFRSDQIDIYHNSDSLKQLIPFEYGLFSEASHATIFYGQSMGYKGEKVYRGVPLNVLLQRTFPGDNHSLAQGLVCIEATDGYRASFSLSEIVNRNDNREPLLLFGEEEEGRKGFSLFCTGDMFADRAIKSVSRITLIDVEKDMSLTGNLIVFHAGSLAMPFKAMADSFMVIHPGVKVLTEASGSIDAARKITELQRDCDIMASADYAVINNLLIPKFASENILFTTNEMALVYTDKSRYAGETDSLNWPAILAKDNVAIGRSDPDADPCGYRTLLTLELARDYYKGSIDEIDKLTDVIVNKDKRFIRPKETDLLALLDAGAVDYIFLYKSVAVQHNLPFIELPDHINMGNFKLNDYYSRASVTVRGSKPGETMTMRGEAMVYGFTILNNAPNSSVAREFAKFILAEDGGGAILRAMGQEPITAH